MTQAWNMFKRVVGTVMGQAWHVVDHEPSAFLHDWNGACQFHKKACPSMAGY
jgi:hypothetical protein